MTVSQVGDHAPTDAEATAEAPPAPSDPRLHRIDDLASWSADFREGLTGEAGADDDGAFVIASTGAGDIHLTAPAPIPMPTGAVALQVELDAAGAP